MATRLLTIAASNYACDTLLSKGGDSTAAFASNPPANDTSSRHSAPYLINSANDFAPVVQGLVTFNEVTNFPNGVTVPISEPHISLASVTLTANVATSLLPYFPLGFNRACVVTLNPVFGADNVWQTTAVGTVDLTGATPVVQGCNATNITGVVGQGTAVTAVNYVSIQPNAAGTDLLATLNWFGGTTKSFDVIVSSLASSF